MKPDQTRRIGFKISLALHLLALAAALAISWASFIHRKPKPAEPIAFVQIPISARSAPLPDIPVPQPVMAAPPESDSVPEPVKEERYARLMEVTERISAARLAAKVGRTLPVIIDAVGEPDEDGDIGATGRSQADAPEIDGAVYLRNVPSTLVAGDIVSVHVEDADAHDLYGVISAASAA